MAPTYLTQDEVASRWRISPRTLERWRWQKTGPAFTKIGARACYALADIEAYERRRRADIGLPIVGTWR